MHCRGTERKGEREGEREKSIQIYDSNWNISGVLFILAGGRYYSPGDDRYTDLKVLSRMPEIYVSPLPSALRSFSVGYCRSAVDEMWGVTCACQGMKVQQGADDLHALVIRREG